VLPPAIAGGHPTERRLPMARTDKSADPTTKRRAQLLADAERARHFGETGQLPGRLSGLVSATRSKAARLGRLPRRSGASPEST
jgi:hypothetical protein